MPASLRAQFRPKSSIAHRSAQLFCLVALLAAPAQVPAQNRVSATVNLAKSVNVLTEASLGLPAVTFDANSVNAAGVPYLRAAGITVARFPGNHGVADLYHWSTRTTTKYRGAEAAYFAPESNFGNFALFAEKLGQGVIVVNYGANLDGTDGGEPAEAAAWVAYANGEPADARPLGKDSTGEDWRTAGYWASLRSEAPMPQDDGFNFLRIHHPQPFGFKLWQIGDQVYNNGYYGPDHASNPDLHGLAPNGPKDFGKLKNDPKLSPSAFAENAKSLATAMKAVDPSILIGAALTTPPDGEKNAPGWNAGVLKAACGSLDFVTLEWSFAPLLPPDWKTLDEAGLLGNTTASLGTLVNSILDQDRKYCPKDHLPRLAFAPAAIATWPRIEHPVVTALWLADMYSLLIESGTLTTGWSEMYGASMLSEDHKKFGPAYYGFQMLHILAHAPGDTFLDAISSSPQVSVHATRHRDGYIGVMLINKDAKAEAAVKITLKNGSAGGAGKRFDYGGAQSASGAPVAVTSFSATGVEFTLTVAPYSITDIILPAHN